jgi:hypothetical protein
VCTNAHTDAQNYVGDAPPQEDACLVGPQAPKETTMQPTLFLAAYSAVVQHDRARRQAPPRARCAGPRRQPLPIATIVLPVMTAALVVIPGCGSGDHKASTTTGSSASSSTTAVRPSASGIRTRVLTSDELAGFRVADVLFYTTPNSWVSGEQISADRAAVETAMLKRDGFRSGVHEDLMSGDGTGGASVVEQFRSPQAAAEALRFYLTQFKANPASAGAYRPFKVTGIPHAVGFSLGATAGGINIIFGDGAYYYLVGQEGGSRAAMANLTAAARHLYHRVHG